MPSKGNACNVEGCHNTSLKNDGVIRQYFRLPAVIKNQGDACMALSEERRRVWLANLQQDFTGKNLANIRVCSDHFVNKKKADLYDKTSPDWAPTVNMTKADREKPDYKSPEANDRYNRRVSRHKKTAAAATLLQFSEDLSAAEADREGSVPALETGIGTQTDVDEPLYRAMVEDMQCLRLENMDLKEQVLRMTNAHKMQEYEGNDDKCKYFTGLPKFCLLLQLFKFIERKLPANRKLEKFQLLILCLMRLRLNLPILFLAHEFHVSTSSASRYFAETIDILYYMLKALIHWPERDELRKTMPMQFRKNFGKKIAVIIDCFEIFVETPSNALARAKLFSNYKHHHTAKYLIGILPQGSISFISKGWGGRTSDKFITEHCGFLNKISHGDVVMADRGFDIGASLGSCGATSEIPAFTKSADQLSPLDVESTRKLANVRIHVERVIGLVRQKYTCLGGTLSTDYLQKKSGEEVVLLDKIVTVACCLVNMCPSVVDAN